MSQTLGFPGGPVALPSGTPESHPGGVTPTTLVRPAIVEYWLRRIASHVASAQHATTTEQLCAWIENINICADNARIHAGRLK